MTDIAILGLGVVGGAVYDAIEKSKALYKKLCGGLNVKYILDKRDFSAMPFASKVTCDINAILGDKNVKVVAETMGGDRPAFDFSLACINAGKSVVTSNKLVVEKHGAELERAAREHGVSYLYEASVGGGIPIIRTLHDTLAVNNIYEINGILNGTTNYILERMENAGLDFGSALAEAQSLGYAERDPSADIEGLDAARKICILASVSFGGRYVMDDCACIRGISSVTMQSVAEAREKGMKIKLVGSAKLTPEGAFLCVRPCAVTNENLLYAVSGVYNCICVKGDLVGETAYYGHGAGGMATASAVVSDIAEAASARPIPRVIDESPAVVREKSTAKAVTLGGVEYELL
ncbi:MAG: homoserine dehydrogenase [Clostridia bacterium]|nr:homoserine dehydrogenase [Clostridia bacterium]